MSSVLRLTGHLNVGLLETALRTVIERHEILRTVIIPQSGIPYQYIQNVDNWAISKTDLSLPSQGELSAYIDSLLYTPFDLSKDYMLRAHLLAVSEHDFILILIVHHIACDGWSISVLVRDLVEIYEDLVDKRKFVLPELKFQ
jgi:NRPS condensation-like uncharacterized protein